MSSFRDENLANGYLRTNFRRTVPSEQPVLQQVIVQGNSEYWGGRQRKRLLPSESMTQRKIIEHLEVSTQHGHYVEGPFDIVLMNGAVKVWTLSTHRLENVVVSAHLIIDGSDEVYLESEYAFEVNAIINIAASVATTQIPAQMPSQVLPSQAMRDSWPIPVPAPISSFQSQLEEAQLEQAREQFRVAQLANMLQQQQIVGTAENNFITIRIPESMKADLERFAADHNMTIVDLLKSVCVQLQKRANEKKIMMNPRIEGVVDAVRDATEKP